MPVSGAHSFRPNASRKARARHRLTGKRSLATLGGIAHFIGIACLICNKLLLVFSADALVAYLEPARIYLAAAGVQVTEGAGQAHKSRREAARRKRQLSNRRKLTLPPTTVINSSTSAAVVSNEQTRRAV